MKITLTQSEKSELLKAVAKGELDTKNIERLYRLMRDNNDFYDLMRQLPDLDEEDFNIVIESNNQIRQNRGKKALEIVARETN